MWSLVRLLCLSVTLGIAGIFAGKVYQRSKLLLRER